MAGVVGYYMTLLIATIVGLSVVMPTVIDQVATISADTTNVSATTRTILGLFTLMIAMGMLMMYMRPLL